jgi:hypothetical protein
MIQGCDPEPDDSASVKAIENGLITAILVNTEQDSGMGSFK